MCVYVLIGKKTANGTRAAMGHLGVQTIDWEHVTGTPETMRKI